MELSLTQSKCVYQSEMQKGLGLCGLSESFLLQRIKMRVKAKYGIRKVSD